MTRATDRANTGKPTIGFEFCVRDRNDTEIWVRVQGSGGFVGDGCLATFDGLGHRQKQHTMTRLLDRVMTLIERDHALTVLVDGDMQVLGVDEVIGVRVVHEVTV